MIRKLINFIFGKEHYEIRFILVNMTEKNIEKDAKKIAEYFNDGWKSTAQYQFEDCVIYEIFKTRRIRN